MCEMILCPMRLNMQTEYSPDENDLIYESVPLPKLPKLEQEVPMQPTQYRTIKGSISPYREDKLIGNGAYGTVYRAHDLTDPNSFVAMKKVRIPVDEDGVPVSILREIAVARQLDKFNHPNIVQFLDIVQGARLAHEFVLYLVFEYVEKDLGKYIHTCREAGDLTPVKIKDITFQILNGVDFLHSQRIVHRDLKPQNLLISRNGRVKLADFGLARIYDFSTRLTSVVVTLWYRAPELLLCGPYGSPVDMWSIGCILAELYRQGHPLFPGQSEMDQLEKIMDYVGTVGIKSEWHPDYKILPESFKPRPGRDLVTLVHGICPLAYDLLKKMLVFNPNRRFTAQQALNHEYFRGLRAKDMLVGHVRLGEVPFEKTPTPSPETQIQVEGVMSTLVETVVTSENETDTSASTSMDMSTSMEVSTSSYSANTSGESNTSLGPDLDTNMVMDLYATETEILSPV